MKLIKSFLVATLVFALCLETSAQVSFGNALKFNDGWTFVLDGSSAVKNVTLPHDWSVKGRLSPDLASCTGYLPGGIGTYTKKFDGSSIEAPHAFIYFEGVYNRSTVSLNGHILGERPSGYASFMYELTPWLNRSGENVLVVKVDHSQNADSRFYTGSGIYRDVWLVTSGETHFAQWGVGYKTVYLSDKSATIEVDANIEGLSDKNCILSAKLKNASGEVVAKSSAKASASGKLSLKCSNPQRWSLDSPYLYTLELEIVERKNVLDKMSCNVGIRDITFDPDKGFALNGKTMKIKGVCLHHDAGVLGAAVPDDVWERRLLNLKQIGVNAIRTSHNPQTPAFYDICDRIGLFVMDEAFDEWEFPKRKWLDGWNSGTPGYQGIFDFFEEWSEIDLSDMVRRDRNHPSIIMWSIGNEVDYPNDPYSHPVLDGGNDDFKQASYGGYKPDAPNAMRIGEIATRLSACVRAIDDSRPVTGALAGVAMSNQTAYPEAVDIVGYNYTESRYALDHSKYPNRVIYGSENSVNYAAWQAVRDNDFISGLFLWTGTDYLGESRAWPSRGFYSGLLDLGSFPKPRGHFFASLWSEAPVCYIGTNLAPKMRRTRSFANIDAWDTWNYSQGDTVLVSCYTNAESASLFLDGKQVGANTQYNKATGVISWAVPFAPGTLKAVGYDASGKVESEYEIKTCTRPYSLRVTSDRTSFESEGDVAHLIVEVLDDNGNKVNIADNLITCTISGPAKLLGLEASDNTDMGDYTDNSQRAYRGRLLAYVQASGSGKIIVKFSSPLLEGSEVLLNL